MFKMEQQKLIKPYLLDYWTLSILIFFSKLHVFKIYEKYGIIQNDVICKEMKRYYKLYE